MGIKVKVEKSREFTEIDDGMYEAELVSVSTTDIPEWGERWRWSFRVVLEEDEIVEVSGLTTTKFSTMSKAYKWFSALAGREPEIGEEVDLDELVGKKALIEIKNVQRGEFKISNVTDVKPLPKSLPKKRKK